MGMTEDDKRNCCLLEIQETEAKYYKTLEDIEKDLIKVHFALLRAIDMAMMAGGADGLAKIFLDFKERLLVYGQYCSHMENAQKTLDHLIATREDVKMKVEECTMKVQEGKFKLQDLLLVPMQRVLKYHLLLKELVSHSTDRPDRQQLKEALEAMQDLAMYINEVKRDNETLKKMSEFQSSIENLELVSHSTDRPDRQQLKEALEAMQQVKLEEYGRPKIDGELKVCSIVNRTKQDRYIFLFDKVVIVCKRRGYSYELKEIIELQCYKMTDDPMHNRDIKKWSYGFFLIHLQGKQGFQFFCKAEDTKRKWMEQFEMAMSNIKPERASANHHNFQMHTFEKTTNCRACKMLLRGIFYQGYYCSKCGTGAHKECLEVITICKINSPDSKAAMDFLHVILISLLCTGFQPKMNPEKFFQDRANTRSPASSASYNFSFLSPQGLNFSSQTSTPFWSVFTPKVIGTAVARYNFAARDMRELSLREGDIVKIYSKIGGDQGWWKGEANGRIGWFPSTYVDEEGVQ
ncbi:UNVERIFIED_CONTAM: hypothetical protein FKN15_022823 [Acipenser sinensis]